MCFGWQETIGSVLREAEGGGDTGRDGAWREATAATLGALSCGH